MEYYIYIHQNKINNKIYVGFSRNYKKRWNETKKSAYKIYKKSYNLPFYRAIRKYGWDNFTHQIIEIFENIQDALEAEKFWIEFFRSNILVYGPDYGYNLTVGGDNPPINHRRKIPPDIGKEISLKYLNGKSINKLSKEYDCSRNTITRSVLENNILIRDPELFNSKTKSKICEKYLKKISVEKLSYEYNCSIGCIYKILKDNNIKCRNKQGLFLENIEEEICQIYLSGKTIKEISKQYNCSCTVIHNILHKYNIKKRTRKGVPSKRKLFDNFTEILICYRYLSGKSVYQISIEFNCSDVTIYNILKRQSINI